MIRPIAPMSGTTGIQEPESITHQATAAAISVLVADSSADFLKTMRGVIEREPGLRLADVAQTATAAFDSFVRQRPDVVITGVFLVDSSGFELLRTIRHVDSRCLLILSAKQPDSFVVHVARLMGADEVCFRHGELTQLREFLRRSVQA